MNCTRCQGLMVTDQLLDLEGTYGQMWAASWRCVNCGRVHDSVIEQNGQARLGQVLVLPVGEPNNRDGQVYRKRTPSIKQAA